MEDYQAHVVGLDGVPQSRQRGKWNFLDDFAPKLKAGQAIRLVIPKGASSSGCIARWKKMKGHGVPRVISKMQPDGSRILWLWFEKQQGEIHPSVSSPNRGRKPKY